MATSTPTLLLASNQDTGVSSSDGITKTRYIKVSGKATPGNRVILFNDVNRDGIADYPDQTVGGVYAGADGTYSTILELPDGAYQIFAIADDGVASSALSNPVVLTIDTQAPTLAAIALVGAAGTSAATVQFTVTFSEAVTAPQASDFALVSTGGLSGAAITRITGVAGSGGKAYTVEASTGTGNGALALQLLGNSVQDLAGNPFGGPFTASTTYTVGPNPASVAVTDVNRDGIPDLIVANLYSSPKNADGTFGAGTLSVLMGNGDGSFRQPVSVAAGAGPYVVQTADFNHDGNVDLAVLNAFAGFKNTGNGNGSVSILFGDGTGAFRFGADYTVGADPEAMTMGDLNHDGLSDLVVADAESDTVSVLLGRSDGTFQARTAYATGQGPNFVAIADLDQDGNADLITANNFDGTLSILRGTGTGSFAPATALAVGSIPNGIAVGDLNGDGKTDLVVDNYGDSSIEVLLGNGNGSFRPGVVYQAGAQAYAVALSDVNGDGRLDVLVSNAGDATLSVLIGNGDGTLRPQTTVPTGNFPSLFATADLNGDGRPDVVTPNYNDGTISVLLNQTTKGVGPSYQITHSSTGASAPVITSNGGGDTAALSIPENGTAVTTVTASDPNPAPALTYSLAGGADANLFTLDAQTGALAFKTAPNFEAPADAGANNVYDVIVTASDGQLSDTQALAIGVTNVNEAASGGVHLASSAQTASSAVLTASNDIVDPDVAQPTIAYRWEASTNGGTTWTAIAGATGASYTPSAAQAGALLRAVARYTDPFGTAALASSETAVVGSGVANTLTGTSAADLILGLSGNDRLTGAGGNDRLDGGAGSDTMLGGAGNDVYDVDNPADQVIEKAGEGTDTVYSSISYALAAGQEIEALRANAGSTGLSLTGNEFANTLVGGAGADTLAGGAGKDALTGGAGADTFVFGPASAASTDSVTDFSSASGDRLQFHASDYALITGAGLNADGTLSADYFEAGTRSTKAHAEFLFNTSSRTLVWDADGVGAGAGVALASFTVPTGTATSSFLHATDFRFA
ncbi:beta strand repeat-containing protein [Methylobacterium sp. ID0610]|uniref:beta strand repeat-containing protein n=1 Tax=Methylobacterium carpenticola TaxID=3344827 RepID=UPI0036843B70